MFLKVGYLSIFYESDFLSTMFLSTTLLLKEIKKFETEKEKKPDKSNRTLDHNENYNQKKEKYHFRRNFFFFLIFYFFFFRGLDSFWSKIRFQKCMDFLKTFLFGVMTKSKIL